MIGQHGLMHKTGTPLPVIPRRRLGKYRHVTDLSMAGRPLLRQGMHIEIDTRLGPPVDQQRTLAVLRQRLLDNRLDRRKAGTTGQQDSRLGRIFTQVEATVRAVEAQNILDFHGRKNLIGKHPARHMADMQLQQIALIRRISQRKAAFSTILEQNINVLPGEKLKVFAGWQTQMHIHDIRRDLFQLFDPCRQGLDRNLAGRNDLLALDFQISLGRCTAIKRQARGLFIVAQGMRRGLAVLNLTTQHLALTGTTGTILAAVRHGQPLAQGSIQQSFVSLDRELAATGLDCYLVAHRFPFVLGYNAGVQKILIVGSGDVARRILPLLARRSRVYALLRDTRRAAEWRALGASPILADLDDLASLRRLAGLAEVIIHLAPPPGEGPRDYRTRRLLAALGQSKSLARQLIYVSTTGVYGDCAGAWIDETRPLHPESARAGRRVDAEQALRQWGARNGVAVSILRAPGIYAADRLPLERLHKALPALQATDDVFTNHIHADDLAAACVAAIRRGKANRAYNVVDDSDLRMGDYFDQVADAFALPRPPRLTRAAAAAALSPVQMSFMRESRRIGNRRLKQELQYRLRYPTVDAGISDALARRKQQCSS